MTVTLLWIFILGMTAIASGLLTFTERDIAAASLAVLCLLMALVVLAISWPVLGPSEVKTGSESDE